MRFWVRTRPRWANQPWRTAASADGRLRPSAGVAAPATRAAPAVSAESAFTAETGWFCCSHFSTSACPRGNSATAALARFQSVSGNGAIGEAGACAHNASGRAKQLAASTWRLPAKDKRGFKADSLRNIVERKCALHTPSASCRLHYKFVRLTTPCAPTGTLGGGAPHEDPDR